MCKERIFEGMLCSNLVGVDEVEEADTNRRSLDDLTENMKNDQHVQNTEDGHTRVISRLSGGTINFLRESDG